jgi:dTDP-4-dehydrorhamnose reductase
LYQRHTVVSTDIDDLDITDPGSVNRTISSVRPHVIINCAAYTNVDRCETEKDLAWRVNVEGPRNLALGLQTHGGRLIHVSTDYIFDGRKARPESYKEADKPHPLSYYGKSKLEGEAAVRAAGKDHIILRTAWLYGTNGSNFLKTILRVALRDPEREIKVVNDQFGSPTWSYRLALQIRRLIDSGGGGTYHATSEGYCSWYELAAFFLETMGITHRVVPCTTEAYPTAAPRPRNSVLENQRLKEEKINLMVHWRADVEQFVSMFRRSLLEEIEGANHAGGAKRADQ